MQKQQLPARRDKARTAKVYLPSSKRSPLERRRQAPAWPWWCFCGVRALASPKTSVLDHGTVLAMLKLNAVLAAA